jgi:hypothetical protein
MRAYLWQTRGSYTERASPPRTGLLKLMSHILLVTSIRCQGPLASPLLRLRFSPYPARCLGHNRASEALVSENEEGHRNITSEFDKFRTDTSSTVNHLHFKH